MIKFNFSKKISKNDLLDIKNGFINLSFPKDTFDASNLIPIVFEGINRKNYSILRVLEHNSKLILNENTLSLFASIKKDSFIRVYLLEKLIDNNLVQLIWISKDNNLFNEIDYHDLETIIPTTNGIAN